MNSIFSKGYLRAAWVSERAHETDSPVFTKGEIETAGAAGLPEEDL